VKRDVLDYESAQLRVLIWPFVFLVEWTAQLQREMMAPAMAA
jgi:hypothetical protein